jgi:hypothetical protein
MSTNLRTIVSDFAACIKSVDSRSPIAVNVRPKEPYQPGIGPHPESQTVILVTNEMQALFPEHYYDRISVGVPYPDYPRQKCAICLGIGFNWEWAIEVKMLRILGDNGKPNDNILMHILSPYPAHRSAVTDCEKLASSSIGEKKAILIYGYESKKYPLIMAVDAFETIASKYVHLSNRFESSFSDLIHPVHISGNVFGWELWAL